LELRRIGYFSKTIGVKGELLLRTELDFDVSRLKAVFIERGGSKAPYFIRSLRESQGSFVIALEEIPSVESAAPFVNTGVFIEAELIIEHDEDFDWNGYEVIDETFGAVGRVNSVSDNGHQVLLSIDHKGREVILPLVEDFIKSVDEEKKILHFAAPEGLIDIYLGEE
jgi:16S rRNA processing protein RimM